MMASVVLDAFKLVGQKNKNDDDLVDRLNHRFTVILLVVFAAFVSGKQFVGEPISCWCPSQFSGTQIAYTNSICWIKGTYYLETQQKNIPDRTENSQFQIRYYQFIPFILLAMALSFYLPHMLWRNLNRQIGYDLRLIIQDVKKGVEKDIPHIAEYIHIAIEYNTTNKLKYCNFTWNICSRSKFRRNRLCLSYIFIKCLYIINCICQFEFLSFVLSFSFYTFGYEWFRITLNKFHHKKINDQPNESKWFPRVVMCDFMVRNLGSNQHWYAIQCNLPINLFNEIIFLILWTWLMLVTILTCLSLFLTLHSIYTNTGYENLRQYLVINSKTNDQYKRKQFFDEYLKWDGILILKIIEENTNQIIMSHLVNKLYNIYLEKKQNQNNNYPQTSRDSTDV